MGRLIARHIGDYIPGHPTVIPVNAPGAGSLLLANQINNTQPKDGTVIGLINRGIPFEPLLGGISVRFDRPYDVSQLPRSAKHTPYLGAGT